MKIYIYGTGEHSRKVYHCAKLLGHEIIAFIDHQSGFHTQFPNMKVIDIATSEITIENRNFFVAVGNNEVRQKVTNKFKELGWAVLTLIHPTAYISEDAKISEGVFVGAHATIESKTQVGNGTIVDIGVVIDHDCVVSEYLHLKPGTVLQSKTVL